MTTVGIIPARYGSTRFPGKPLTPIAGVPMIQRVYEQCLGAKSLRDVIVATDDRRIALVCEGFGAKVRMTREDHPTGTDRLAEAAADLPDELIVNIQGDEPLIEPSVIDAAVEALLGAPEASMSTVVHPLGSDARDDPNRVKVVLDQNDYALYFSRSPIPFRRSAQDADATGKSWQHVGLYVYRRAFLQEFIRLPRTPAEQAEELEQLRALEHGHRIRVAIIDGWSSTPVDVPEDVARVEALLRDQKP